MQMRHFILSKLHVYMIKKKLNLVLFSWVLLFVNYGKKPSFRILLLKDSPELPPKLSVCFIMRMK